MLRGFGMDSPTVVGNSVEAKEHLLKMVPDLILIAAVVHDMEASDLIRWIRPQKKANLRFLPIIVLTGYTQLHTIMASRMRAPILSSEGQSRRKHYSIASTGSLEPSGHSSKPATTKGRIAAFTMKLRPRELTGATPRRHTSKWGAS